MPGELPWPALLVDVAGDVWAANRAASLVLADISTEAASRGLEAYMAAPLADCLRNALHYAASNQSLTAAPNLNIDSADSAVVCVVQPLDQAHDPALFSVALLKRAEPVALPAALSAAIGQCFDAATADEFLATIQTAAAPFGLVLNLALRNPQASEWLWMSEAEGHTSSQATQRSTTPPPALADTNATPNAGWLSLGPVYTEEVSAATLTRQNCLTLPLATRNEQWGMLSVSGPGLNEVTEALFLPLGQLLGLAIERLQQRAGLHRDQLQTALLLKAGQALTAVTELDAVLQVICEQALNLSSGLTASLLAPEPEGEHLRCIMAVGPSSELLLGQRGRITDTFAGRVFREAGELVIGNATEELAGDVLATQVPELRSVIVLALRAQRRTVGLLAVWHDHPYFFGPVQQRILEQYSSAAAVAIEKAQLHEAMRRSEERYRTLFQNALELVITLDLEGRIISWNRAALQFLGLSPAELRGGRVTMRDLMLPEQAGLMAELQTRALEGYAPVPTEIKMVRPDGALTIVEITVQLLLEQGQPQGVYIIGRDITERRQLEAQLRQGEKLAALGQLAAGAAHELNNPLAVVLGTTQLLLRDPLAAAFCDDIRNIEAAAQRAKYVIKQMLTFAREHDDVRGPVELSGLIERVLQGKRQQLEQHGIQVDLALDTELPAVWGDAYQLEQVVDNLLHNAAQALGESRSSSRRISIGATAVGKMLRLSIADNGPGIAPQVLPRIFDPFFTTKEVGSGTGLGLSLVFGIVDKHGGSIRAESVYGQGATFIVDLPVSKVAAAKVSPAAIRGPRSCTILVVEDEFDVRTILERALTQYGYSVDTVESAEAALIRLTDKHYDLVITDMRMRGMSGRELFERVRVTQPEINWVFVTGDTMNVTSEAFLKQTGVPYLPKPFSLEELWEAVALSIVGNHQPSTAA